MPVHVPIRVRLRRRLLVVLSALTVVALSGAAVWTQQSAGEAVKRVQRADREALQRALAGLTDQYFNATFLAASTAASSTPWTLTPRDGGALRHLVTTSPLTSFGAAVVGVDGRVIATSGTALPPSEDPGYLPLRQELLEGKGGLSNVMTVAGHQVVAFAVPIRRGAAVRALLLVYADIRQWPLQAYNTRLYVGREAVPYVTDANGVVAASGVTASLGTKIGVPLSSHMATRRVAGRDVVVSADSASRGWTAVTVQSASAYSAGLASSRTRALAALVILLTAMLALIVWAVYRAHNIQQRLAEERLYDPLTGLGQRQMLHLKLDAAFARRRRTGSSVGVLYCDLDDFKAINDLHGHNAGDRLLEVVAERLVASIRLDDMALRLGGDEFAIVAEGLTRQGLADLADRITRAVEQAATVGRVTVVPRVSVGGALAGAEDDATALLQAADVAMYGVKQARRARPSEAADDVPASSEGHALLGVGAPRPRTGDQEMLAGGACE